MLLLIIISHYISKISIRFRKSNEFCAIIYYINSLHTVTALEICAYPRIKVFDAGGVDCGRFFDPVNRKWLFNVSQRQLPRSLDLSGDIFVNGDVQLISRYVAPHKA